VFVGAEEGAYDIVSHLKGKGFAAEHVSVYTTTIPVAWPEARATRTLSGHYVTACFASPSAVKGFMSLFASVAEMLPSVHAVAIGETTARACKKYFRNVTVATQASMENLVQKAAEVVRSRDPNRRES